MYTGVNIPIKLWQCKMYCNNCTAQCTICCTANLDRVRVQTHKQIYATTHVGHVRFELGPLRYNYRLDRMNKTGISRTDKSSSYNLTQGVLQNIIPLCLIRTSSYQECFILFIAGGHYAGGLWWMDLSLDPSVGLFLYTTRAAIFWLNTFPLTVPLGGQ